MRRARVKQSWHLFGTSSRLLRSYGSPSPMQVAAAQLHLRPRRGARCLKAGRAAGEARPRRSAST
eukprot:12509057-Alexandrium_andersonii.AAC.1